MRETFKDVEVGNRKFRLKKFDPLTGSYIVYTVLTKVLPMGLSKQVEGLGDSVEKNLPAMTKEEFIEIQKDCLRACSEIRPEGDVVLPIQVMMADGRWGVEDIDAPLAIILTIQVLGYNLQSFFEGNALEMFQKSIYQLNLPSA